MRVKGVIFYVMILLVISSCSAKKSVSDGNRKSTKQFTKTDQQQYYYIFIEANRKKLLGDLKSALALYYECLKLKPDAAAAMAEIAGINTILGNYDAATKYAKSAVENDSLNKWYKIQLAELFIQQKKFKEAVEVYEKAYQLNKKDLEIPYKLAALYAHIKDYNQAIDLYNQLENKTGVNENLSLAKQQLYFELGNKTKAYDEIQNLIKHYPNEPRYYGILAEMYTNDNLFIKAEENYKKLFKLDSTNTLGLLSIIDFYRKKMDYESAFETIRKVLDSEQIDYNRKVMVLVSVLNTKSEFSIYNKQIKELLLYLKKAYPDKKDSYTLYADYLIKMNLFDDAEKEIKYILDRFSGNLILWEQLLSIYSYNNDFESLYVKSETAIDSFPEYTLFYLFNGVSANQTGHPKKSAEVLEKGLKLVKNKPELRLDFYTNLGEAYNDIKNYKESDYYFNLALELDPKNLYIINNYSYYLSLREEKLDYAASISKKLIEAEPSNSTYLDTYAWVLFKQAKYQDALYYIKKAFENGGAQSQVIVEHFGDIQYKVGNLDAAVELWKMARELGNNDISLQEKINNKLLN